MGQSVGCTGEGLEFQSMLGEGGDEEAGREDVGNIIYIASVLNQGFEAKFV